MHSSISGLLLFALVQAAFAQSLPAAMDGLRAELHLARTLVPPGEPIRVTFMLRNMGDEPVSIAVPAVDIAAGFRLPPAVVFGSDREPCAHVTFENQPPDVLLPPRAADGERDGVLVIGPRSAIATEYDITQYTKYLRYTGDYKLDWQPRIEGVAKAEIAFRVEARKRAILSTDYGKLTIELAYKTAPRNVDNFLELVRSGYYTNNGFYRIVPGFVIQGGAPPEGRESAKTDAAAIPSELTDAPFDRGAVAMALKIDADGRPIPDSASCQFFIALTRLPALDGKYTIIGWARDEESMRTLQRIEEVKVDDRNHPKEPVSIRSITLLDVESPGPTRFESASQPGPIAKP